MSELPAASRMRDLCHEVIATLQQVFGEHVDGYVIGALVDSPYPSAELEFELYGYFPMIFGYDRGILGFAIDFDRSVYIPLPLRRSSDLEREGAMLELVESLRDAVLLRIPDKYLDAIGVERERQSAAPTPPTLSGSASSARPGPTHG